jgi:hypothetical protein
LQQMRLPNHPNPALHKRVSRRFLGPILCLLSIPLISLAACSGGNQGTSRLSDFFNNLSQKSPTPTATPAPPPPPTPAASPTPEAEEIREHPAKKPAKQAHAAPRPPASAPTPVEGEGKGAEVSLEPNPGGSAAGGLATPAASVSAAPPGEGTPTLSSSASESSGASDDATPAKAAKLINEVYRVERRVDRENLTADDSQRDILAQKLLTEAKESLEERDSAAALSLATKASTLLAPLPKLADSAIPSAP